MDPATGSDTIYFFERNYFLALADRYRSLYRRDNPFPHVVIDDFLPHNVAKRLAQEFPPPGFSGYRQPDNAYQRQKLGRTQESAFADMPAYLRVVLNEFNGMVFLDFLERLTGIPGLIGDSHFQGGALHQILPQGKLSIHADFNRDDRRKLDRRLNFILYLNEEWKDEYGGHLELWNRGMTRCEARVAPLFNRGVIFNTTSYSYHGHPDPLTCPSEMTRKSIATYFYSNGRPIREWRPSHATLWQARPNESFERGLSKRQLPRVSPANWLRLVRDRLFGLRA